MASLGSDTTGDFYNGVPESTKEFIPDRLSLNLDSYEMYIPPASECVASVDDVMGFWEPPEAEEDDEDDEDDDDDDFDEEETEEKPDNAAEDTASNDDVSSTDAEDKQDSDDSEK